MDPQEVVNYWEGNAPVWTDLCRQGYDVYRDLFNAPAFQVLLGDVAGLEGLDVGCGEGYNTRLTAARGARMTAVDPSPTFIRFARQSESEESLGIDYQLALGQELPFGDEAFDFVMATMSLMDMPNPERAMAEAWRVLRPGGFFQFSITHPCFMTSRWRWLFDESGQRSGVECGRYWEGEDARIEKWIFSSAPEELRSGKPLFQVPRFDRTLSEWINDLLDLGFMIERLAEPRPDEATAREHPEVADARIVAYFLHVRARKAG